MQITDLVDDYIENVIERDAPADYERMRPALFDHYHTFWSETRLYSRDRDIAILRGNREMIRSTLGSLDAKFANHGLVVSNLEVVLFVGHGTTNGHAFLENGRFVVWIPVETYPDAPLANVFLTHEIIHALHYSASPSFYFNDTDEQNRIARLLITEGIATYLTAVILDVPLEEALWGRYFAVDQLAEWMAQSERRFGEMCAFFLQNFDCSIREHGLFCLGDTGDVFQSRGGYFTGARLVRPVAEEHGMRPADLLALKRPRLEERIRRRIAAACH